MAQTTVPTFTNAIGTARVAKLLHICDAESSTTDNPTSGDSSVGVPLSRWRGSDQHIPSAGALCIKVTGTGTLTLMARLWVWSSGIQDWLPLGPGTATGKGQINNGVTIAEDEADVLLHEEPVAGLNNFSHIYFEIETLGGTSPSCSAYLEVND